MKKRIVNLLVSMVLILTYSILDYTGANALSVNDSSVFLKQQTNYTCTLTSAAMMLRRRAIIDGGDCASITESSLRSTAWTEDAGLKSGFSFAGISVSRAYFSNPTSPASELISLLANHPEGIEVYNDKHAILVTDYDSATGTFYCADPWPTAPSGRIPLSSSVLSGNDQQSKLAKLVKYWYITNRSGGGSNPENVPPTLGSPDQNTTFSVHTSITFTWSNVGSRYHFIITAPSGSTDDIYPQATNCSYSPNIAGTWKWKVRYESDTGKTGPWSQERTFTVTDNSTPQPASESYSVQYYKDVGCGSIGGSVSSESGLSSINKNWGTGGSPNGCTSNQFSAVFNGSIYFTAGWYRFNYTVDDSIKLWLTKDGVSDCICDNNGQKDSPQSGGRFYNIKSAGNYDVRVEYIKSHAGTGVVQVSWTPVAPPMLNLYFDSMGGSPVATATVLCDSKVAQPADPAKNGYTFGGWYRQPDCTEAFHFSSDTIGGDTTLYAKWNLNRYTVSFDSQGGSAVGNLSVFYQSTFAKPANPARPGYVFAGWYTDYSYQYAWNFASDFVVADIVLFAKWTPSARPDLLPTAITYDNSNLQPGKPINFDSGIQNIGNADTGIFNILWTVNSVEMGAGPHSGIAAGTTVMNGNSAFTWTPAVAGTYTIAFIVDCDGQVSESNESNNTILTTVVVPAKTYAVTFNSQGGSAVSSKTVSSNSTLTVPAAPMRLGFLFRGWYKEAACIHAWNFSSDRVTGNLTLYAKWTPLSPITVSNTAELIQNIKSNTILVLQAGEYDLGDAMYSSNSNVWYETQGLADSYYSPTGATISNVTNLELRAATNAKVVLYSNNPYDNVLIANNCNGVILNGITLGHKIPAASVCSAGVVYLLRCANVQVTQCDVYGCGTVGFTVDQSTSTNVTKCAIHHCKYGAALLADSRKVTFKDSTIRSNGTTYSSALFSLYNTTSVTIDHCSIVSNGYADNPNETMIQYDGISRPTVINCTSQSNFYQKYGAGILTMQFNTMGGTSLPPKITDSNTTLTAPPTPTRTGFTFGGWYKQAACTTVWNFATDKVTANTTLYARWTVNKYAITATSNNIAWGSVSGGGSIAFGTQATVKATPRAGYRFVRWLEGSTTVSTNYQYSFTVTKARTLRAEFVKIGTPVIKATSAGYSSIKLAWAAIAGAQGYEIFRYDPATKLYKVLATVTTTNYTNIGLTTNTAYSYKVRAKCAAGSTITFGGYSAVVSAKPIPAAPAGVKAARVSSSSVKISWNAVTGANGYEVCRCTTSSGNYTPVKSVTTLNWTNAGLASGKTYYYKVRAYRSVGGTKVYSSYSVIVYMKP